ncbi:MAG: M1 family metallopeptidase [Patescibacteria group bacterium]
MSKNVTRLFEQFQPENYDLSLNIDREGMTFAGSVVVHGKKVGRPSQRITLHQKDLKVTSATVVKHDKKGDQTIEVTRVNNQDSYDEVRLHTESMIYPGEYTIKLEFASDITRPMHGIYPCVFEHDGKDKKLIASQFESHHAREAFPCIDEPEAKATFDLTISTPAGETALGNTPIKSQKTDKDKLITSFETTPKMSVYLLAFVCGEISYKEGKTKNGTVVKCYATPDNVEHTTFSVEVAVKCLEFFEDYFGVAYPLPKLDMVALPDFAVGAMENWGLITYRESVMLVDEKSSSIESRQICALVVAHELSHQWFGNLVTMKWWDDLWLNESFANMMEYLSVDAIWPEWKVWEQFVSHETVSAKRRDSIEDVQAVHCEVRHPDEISTLFDPSIVYAKGGSLLHMLMRYIGDDAFRRGLKIYFDKHQYGNTQAQDLWAALSDSSGQDIAAFMDGWLERPGYPLVDVGWQPGTSQVSLSQRRFLSDPKAEVKAAEPWHVPLASTQGLSSQLFTESKAELTIKAKSDEPLLLNHDGQSYFLPYYSNDLHMLQILSGLKDGKVSTIDRLLLLDNYSLLQRGGISNTVELLELLTAYEGEQEENVWGMIAMNLAEVRRLIDNDEASIAKLDALIQPLVTPLIDKLGWDDQPGDDAHTLRLRGLIHALAAGAKLPAVIDEGLKRFAAFDRPSDLPASIRSVVYHIGSRHGTDQDFKKLFDLYSSTKSADEKDEIASGLTGAHDPGRYKQLIDILSGEVIRRQDLLHWFAWLLRNRHSRAASWQWMVNNWVWIEQEFASDKNYDHFPRFAGSVFSHASELADFRKFFDDKRSIVALTRNITLGEQEIISRVAWRDANEKPVKDWLKNLK